MKMRRKKTPTAPTRKAPATSVRWIDRVRKWSLVFPRDMVPRIQKAAERQGVTYSQYVVAAVAAALSERRR